MSYRDIAYSESRRRDMRALLRVANAAVRVPEPREWACRPDPKVMAREQRASETRIARLQGRLPEFPQPRVVMRLDADVAAWLEGQRQDGEGVYEGNSRIIRELRGAIEQRDAYIAGLEEELAS